MLRPTVSLPDRLVVKLHLCPEVKFLLPSDSCGFADAGSPLWRDDRSVVYNCCWISPAQSFPGPNLSGLLTIFRNLRFEILQPGGIGWPSYTAGHWAPFSSPLRTRRATAEVATDTTLGADTGFTTRRSTLSSIARQLARKQIRKRGDKTNWALKRYTALLCSQAVTGLRGPRLPHFVDNHRRRWGCQPCAPTALHLQEKSWYSFLLETGSTPGP
jgi:hypothetical protein